jgi:hypothetical protein
MIKWIVLKKRTLYFIQGLIRLWKWPNYYTNICLGSSDTIIIFKILYVLSAKVGDESMNSKNQVWSRSRVFAKFTFN